MGNNIDVIKRNSRLEYRCGSTTSDTYQLDEEVEKPFFTAEEAINHMVQWQLKNHYGVFEDLSDPAAKKWLDPETEEQAIKSWHKYIQKILANKGSDYYDLDSYAECARKLAGPEFAREFLLGPKERSVLIDADKYLMAELVLSKDIRLPSENFRLPLFQVTIDKLTDCDRCSRAKPNPALRRDEVTALNQANVYIAQLERTYA
jgi:hypothetical protein